MAIRMHLACDVCGAELLVASPERTGGGARTIAEARAIGKLLGWVSRNSHDICEDCTLAGWQASRTPDARGRRLRRLSPSA